MLEVRLIRKFDIQINGEPITLSARAAQSLFAFLILTAGTKHRREKLAGMFWPDLSEQKARTYLRQEHWRIRKTLSLKKTFDYLITDDVVVTFNPSAKYDLCVARVTKLNDHASVEELIDGLTVYK